MGFFDKFKKKVTETPPVTEPKATLTPEPQAAPASAPEAVTIGWDAIEQEFLRVYPGQTSPKHYGTLIKWKFGGNDPLDGISIYDGGDFFHFVTFGLSEIYEKECENPEISGYGYEMTLKLKKSCIAPGNEEAEIKNICGILQTIARITFNNNEVFLPDEFIYTGQTAGMDAKQQSLITGFITVKDPTVETINTPNGRVEFLELIGMTDAELKTLSKKDTVRAIYEQLGSDLTDYSRASIV